MQTVRNVTDCYPDAGNVTGPYRTGSLLAEILLQMIRAGTVIGNSDWKQKAYPQTFPEAEAVSSAGTLVRY